MALTKLYVMTHTSKDFVDPFHSFSSEIVRKHGCTLQLLSPLRGCPATYCHITAPTQNDRGANHGHAAAATYNADRGDIYGSAAAATYR